MIVALAVFFSSISALTGILAIGSGRHWQFGTADYFRGKRNAVLYLWVTASTIFSICHAGVLVDYGLDYHWGLRTPSAFTWMVLHACFGILLSFAHAYVAQTLSKEVGPVDKFIWGSRRAAVQ